jgi:hypothetical protein
MFKEAFQPLIIGIVLGGGSRILYEFGFLGNLWKPLNGFEWSFLFVAAYIGLEIIIDKLRK